MHFHDAPVSTVEKSADVGFWPIATQIDVGSHFCHRGLSRIVASNSNPTDVILSGHGSQSRFCKS
jgi:hypothetical protein